MDKLFWLGNIKLLQSPRFTCWDLQLLMLTFRELGNRSTLSRTDWGFVALLLFNLRDLFVCLCVCLVSLYNGACVCVMSLHMFLYASPKTHSTLMVTACPVDPEQWVPSRCSVTAAGSHQLGGQVLLSGCGAAFNECWARPVESPCGGCALGNREQEPSREGRQASCSPEG